MRDITLEETLYFNFTTRSFSTGVPTVLAGTPVLSVIESNNATPITAGVSVSVDRASVVGLNQATVVATAANGYEAGKSYSVYISTGTVGGVSVVGEVVAQFTVQAAAAFTRLGAPAGASVSADLLAIQTDVDTGLAMISNIAAVGGSVNTVAESYVLTTGTQTSGTYASTALLDAVPHTHTDTAGTLDLYYQFDIGVQGLPSSVGVTAYANGAGDDIAIQAYNWGGAAFETVGTIIGKSGATYDQGNYTLLTRHVGTGANIGKVRIRFYATGLTSATLRVDQAFVSYMVGQAYQYTPGTVNTAGATPTVFATTLTQANDFWNDALLIFTSGALAGQSKPIQDFANASGTITLDEPLTSSPANGDAFVVKAAHIHPVSQLQAGLATATELALVKAKTDSLTFTVAGQVDANVQRVNDVTIVGNGSTTPFTV